MTDAIRRRLIIHGRVQGVGYRYWTVQTVGGLTAEGFALTGWVRNRSAGTVEILVGGDREAVEALIEACRQGRPAAGVGHVEILEVEPGEPESSTFEQLPTL